MIVEKKTPRVQYEEVLVESDDFITVPQQTEIIETEIRASVQV